MPGGPSLGRTLLVAGVVHAALFLLSGLRPAVRPAAPRLDADALLVTVETVPEVPPPPAPPSDVPDTERAAPSAVARLAPVAHSARSSPTEPVSSAIVAPESAPPSPSGWTLRVAPGAPGSDATPAALATLALDGHNRFMGRRETPEEAAHAAYEKANRAAGEAIRSAMHDHDVSLGLGGSGPVANVLEAAVRQSVAPEESHAVLVAIADATGTVLRVEVESATDNSAYREIAQDVLNRMRGQKVRVPEGSHGLAMHIEVASRLAMPSGGGVGIDPKSLGGHFDMGDIAAKPHRVVHTRVLAEDLL